jgi:hypothetical protein
MKLQLPKGTTGFFNDRNEWVCTGSKIGRRNVLPDDKQAKVKLHLQHLPFVDGCYDSWGAYWGAPANIYLAFTCSTMQGYPGGPWNAFPQICVYVRAGNRQEAKQKVRAKLPNARFYR